MSITGMLGRGRELHEQLMTDTVTITKTPTDRGPLDPGTGLYTPSVDSLYTGKARIKAATLQQRSGGERNHVLDQPMLVLPYDAVLSTDSLQRAVVTVTASANPALVGREFSLVGEEPGSTSSARRFRLEWR